MPGDLRVRRAGWPRCCGAASSESGCWRLWGRGFNQSALIADHLGRLTGLAVDKHGLRRVKRTQPLRGMNPKQRAQAVRGAFALGPDHKRAGRVIWLVDDVHTSGATAAACAKA